jgi:hypothetical protein
VRATLVRTCPHVTQLQLMRNYSLALKLGLKQMQCVPDLPKGHCGRVVKGQRPGRSGGLAARYAATSWENLQESPKGQVPRQKLVHKSVLDDSARS